MYRGDVILLLQFIEFLFQVCHCNQISIDTYALTIRLFDMFMEKYSQELPQTLFQLLAGTVLLISSKLLDASTLSMKTIIEFVGKGYTSNDFTVCILFDATIFVQKFYELLLTRFFLSMLDDTWHLSVFSCHYFSKCRSAQTQGMRTCVCNDSTRWPPLTIHSVAISTHATLIARSEGISSPLAVIYPDNAPGHTKRDVMQLVNHKYECEILQHPNLSLDDFFPKVKNELRGRRFTTVKELNDAFHREKRLHQ